MKKMALVLVTLLLVLVCTAACADEFTFRGGLHFGMTIDEVLNHEGRANDLCEMKTAREMYTYIDDNFGTLGKTVRCDVNAEYTVIYLDNLTVSDFQAGGAYVFVSGKLAAVALVIPSNENLKTLNPALTSAYGEPKTDMTANMPKDVENMLTGSGMMGGSFFTCWDASIWDLDDVTLSTFWYYRTYGKGRGNFAYVTYQQKNVDWDILYATPTPVPTKVPNTNGL